MFYVIKRLDLNQTPVYLNMAMDQFKPINVTNLDAATPFVNIETALAEIEKSIWNTGKLGRITIVGVEEVPTPRYREVAL